MADEGVGKQMVKHGAIHQAIIELELAAICLESLKEQVAGSKPEAKEKVEPRTPDLAEFLNETEDRVRRLTERLAVVEKELRDMLY